MPNSRYRWFMLALAALTHTFVMGMPTMSLPVLFPEIARDLGLTLVEVGIIWGISSLTSIVTALLAGAVGDRIGAKNTLMIACILAGILGAARGLSSSFVTLAAFTLLFGLVPTAISTNVHKTCGIWFSGPQLGLANGVASAGMALGFMLGSFLAATVLSPRLGGWRNVLFFYGAVAVVMGILWSTVRPGPETGRSSTPAVPVSLRQGLAYVSRIRSLWVLGFVLFGIGGGIQGALGYLPTFLRGAGWPGPLADSALATFHATSLIFAIPVALLSDRLGIRRQILLVAGLIIATGIGLLAMVSGPAVWVTVMFAGMVRDGFMGVYMTYIIEQPGVGARWAGTAAGLTSTLSMLATAIAPPLGNSLAAISPNLPFVFWSALAFMGAAGLYYMAGMQRPAESHSPAWSQPD